MTYVKALLVGLIALAISLVVFTLVLSLFSLDARYFMGADPVVTLLAAAVIFAAAFRWQIVHQSRQRVGGTHARTT